MQTNCLLNTKPMLRQIFLMLRYCFALEQVQKTAVMTSLYASKEKADQAMAARKPLLEDVKAKIKSINTHEGEAHQLR